MFRFLLRCAPPVACLVAGAMLTLSSAIASPNADGDAPPVERTELTIEKRDPATFTSAPAIGSSVQIGGEPIAPLIAGGGMHYRAGQFLIDTALPEGYPAPTAPGAIEVKSYPGARRAEVSGSKNPDFATNFAFFRLFEHIQEREIAMTSPVEMDYTPGEDPTVVRETGWTMSFLYRTPRMGEAGDAGAVTVVDRPAITVLSIGIQGGYGARSVLDQVEILRAWVDRLEGWEVAGSPRGLFYNGPNVRAAQRWGEAQLPIRPVASETLKPENEAPKPPPPAKKKQVLLTEVLLPAVEREE